ncbi:MAG TPA: prolipoprotein diacylglyceryl transferase [Acidimicrobiia bacterium]|nr:prolipoprotein diacylglyceryl transferase [Acidimicrobiia bacterium]
MTPVIAALLDYDPIVTIDLGPLSVSPHGLGIALGYVLGAWLFMVPAAARRGITEDQVYSMLARGVIGAIVGARIAYVINHPGDYSDNPLEALKVWEGGISLLGGITGAVLAAATRMRSDGISFWKVMDAVVPGLAFGIIIGRMGDLVIADHLGKATDFFLGYECPPLGVETGSECIAGPGNAVHQPALYDLISASLLLPVLLWLRRRPRYDGFLTLVFAAWYGAGRFIEDFFRIDETHGTGLTGSQWTAVVVMVVAVYWLLAKRRTPWRSGRGELASVPGDPPVGYDTPEYRAAFDEWAAAVESHGDQPPERRSEEPTAG